MNKLHFTQEQLVQIAKLSDADIRIINECRGEHNKLGIAYQLCYVKLFNRLPMQRPLELLDELATFVAVQLDIPKETLHIYSSLRQATVSEHQESIRIYLRVEKYNQNSENVLKDYILAIFDYPPGKVKQDKDSFQESKHKGRSRPSLNGVLLLSDKT